MSVVRSRAENLGIDPKFYEGQDIHIHVPEGATLKMDLVQGLEWQHCGFCIIKHTREM